ncbi:2Fe-2S iron-sulfur cluster-binding protein [Oceanospirillum beijerinckii]|uniref:2Fe-2S iron-sulfur cluster-binding protein n=1 Tax=Oceanospirillum beijerinckii TaxID=64976 RepID=UPI0004002DB3|nr:2Fe-2S iron-sulfur cluster binding domain-containing protein [Oceanospirillum beijerinckii]
MPASTEIQVSKDQSLLDAMLDVGIEHPHSCKTGACRSCAIKVVEGDVDHKDQCLSPSERKTQLCPCVSRSHSDLLLLDL